MKEYSTFPQASGLSYPGHLLGGCLTPLQRWDLRILQYQLTILDKVFFKLLNDLKNIKNKI